MCLCSDESYKSLSFYNCADRWGYQNEDIEKKLSAWYDWFSKFSDKNDNWETIMLTQVIHWKMGIRFVYRTHLAWCPQCDPPNFVIFNLEFILTYPTDLICLAFVVRGGRCQHNWRVLKVWRPQNVLCYLYTYVENFIFLQAWVAKNFERHIWGGLPICGNWN